MGTSWAVELEVDYCLFQIGTKLINKVFQNNLVRANFSMVITARD
jgi:hypothetical protein